MAMSLRRRDAAWMLAAALGTWQGRAQAAGAPRGLVGSTLPCPAGPADITGFALEAAAGTGSAAGAVAVFGQAFRPGDVPSGASLVARLADGRLLPVQADVLVRHGDRSARHALLSVALPAHLPPGTILGAMLATGAGPARPALEPDAVAAGRRAVVEIVPASGGVPWRVDLLAALRDASAQPGAGWQSGPLAVQSRVQVPVPPSAVGCASMRLAADIALRADGTLWVDLWLRNDVALGRSGGAARYAVRVLLDGRQALHADVPVQAQYQGWGRLLGVANGGAAAAPPHVRQDPAYLADTGVVARYDGSAGVAGGLLAGLAAAVAAPAWATPLGARGVVQQMPQTGGRSDIGPATQAQVIWLLTGDPRAASYAVGQAEAGGGIPWHFWVAAAADGRGTWLNSRDQPRLWTDGRGGTAPPGGLTQQVSDKTGWAPDSAHQPDLAWLPYLLTGRRALLDELNAQASWCVMGQWPGARGGAEANLVRQAQVRGAAWSLRQVSEAAWINPDAEPGKPWLEDVAARNWRWLVEQIPAWTAQQGEAHGWIPGEYGTPGALPPWQQDYFASTVAAAAKRGSADALVLLRWMENFLAGRFLAASKGFDPHDGAAYLIGITPPAGPGGRYCTSWAEIAAATRQAGWSNGTGWANSQGAYPQLALATLATLIDVTGSDGARRAYAWLRAAGAPFTTAADYARDPAFSIVPNDTLRAAGRGGTCTQAASPRQAVR